MRIELPRMGHEVTVCEDGETALGVLAEHHFDAAIVDLKMPGISGWGNHRPHQAGLPETL
ncbi:MAG: hypothetical protein Ct9H300mP1_21790 [Planctomycetaceae bacterium]|nr:MAG: hypothetical protein Ct9H300mP1_21790 [Planctomycetaceae bacterium]